mgnify:CR=1
APDRRAWTDCPECECRPRAVCDCTCHPIPIACLPWCCEPAEVATWTPDHGWIDLCTRHHAQIARAQVAAIIEKATR